MNALSARRGLVAAGTYLTLMTALVYVAPDSEPVAGWVGWAYPGGLVALHLGTGYVIGRVWAAALPLAVVLISVPAPMPENDEFPAWFALLFAAPFGIALIVLGILATLLTHRLAPGRKQDTREAA